MNKISTFRAIIAPAADSVDQLRAIDLDRVLMNAQDNFPKAVSDFVAWLEVERSDLKSRIAATISDFIEDGAWTNA